MGSAEDTALPPLVLLAAGNSRRMGTPKAFLDYRGTPWFLVQIGRFLRSGGDRCVVVAPPAREEFERSLKNEGGIIGSGRVTLVSNPDPDRGPFSSLQEGLKAKISCSESELEGGCFVLPVDVPVAAPAVWRKLAGCRERADAVIPTYEERGGHPVWLGANLIRHCLGQDPGSRLDSILRGWPQERVLRLQVEDASIRLNLNTAEEWEKFRSRS